MGALQQGRGRQFVLATTNERALRAFVGPDETVEMLEMPFDLDGFARALRAAAVRRG